MRIMFNATLTLATAACGGASAPAGEHGQ